MKQVVVAIIRRPEDGKFLLIRSKKDFGENTGALYPPGGHMEDIDHGKKEETLKRELLEELGIEVEPIREITESSGDVKDQVTYWWECTMKSGQKITVLDVGDAGFYSREEMKNEKVWPATRKFFEEFIDKPTRSTERRE